MSKEPKQPQEEKPLDDTQPTQPGERLRRLVASAQDGDSSVLTGGTGPLRMPAQSGRLEDQTSLPAEEAKPLSSEKETSRPSDESASIGERHPTGEPEETAGWFGEDLERLEKGEAPADTAAVSRHPTGAPEETGGWYGEGLEEPAPGAPAEAEQTRPSPAPLPTPPPDQQATRVSGGGQQPAPPPYGKSSADLPRRVEEVDPDATRVTPAAYQRSTAAGQRPRQAAPAAPPSGSQRPGGAARQTASPAGQSVSPPSQPQTNRWKKPLGCLLRGLIGLLFLAVIIAVLVGSFLVVRYFSIAASLPSIEDLPGKASQFETTRLLDRNGNLIYEIIDPNAGRRTYVPLEKISPFLIAATIATEDKDFYTHPGFDPWAIARALWQNYTSGEVVSGASTITQQLARALLLADERYEQTVDRKAREIVLAAEITRRYSKEEILELYLNENYYGKLAYGVEAAAETYFNTTADKLTLGQAAFLAGIPQAPAIYDIETNREATLNRFRTVVVLMYELSRERNCIDVSTSLRPVCVDAQAAAEAVREIENYNFQPVRQVYRFPHWVDYIRAQLEERYDPATIYRSGFTVYTTLDPNLQEQAQNIVAEQVRSLSGR
ncbi:MAG: transglycosylase domain-containing protein, partial [Bellilinea sp.]